MVNEIELNADSEISDKFVLLQFASQSGKYEDGKTVGIKICGSFPDEEMLQKFADDLYSKGQIYFKMETQAMGQWLAFPEADSTDKGEFINGEAAGFKGESFNLNAMYKERIKNKSEKDTLESTKKETIKGSTYYYQPETEKDLEYLISLIVDSLKNYHIDYLFYKDVADHTKKQYDDAVEEEIETVEEIIDKDNDYLELTKNQPSDKLYALFSFANETSNQKTKDGKFAYKIRGLYNNMDDFNKRKDKLMLEDPNFDIYNFPVGDWVAFNSKQNFNANEDLNTIVGKEIKKQLRVKKDFESRVQKCKEGSGTSNDDPVFTKNEYKSNLDIANKFIDDIKNNAKEYVVMLDKNLALWNKKYSHLQLDSDIVKDIDAIQKELKDIDI